MFPIPLSLTSADVPSAPPEVVARPLVPGSTSTEPTCIFSCFMFNASLAPFSVSCFALSFLFLSFIDWTSVGSELSSRATTSRCFLDCRWFSYAFLVLNRLPHSRQEHDVSASFSANYISTENLKPWMQVQEINRIHQCIRTCSNNKRSPHIIVIEYPNLHDMLYITTSPNMSANLPIMPSLVRFIPPQFFTTKPKRR